MQSPSKLQQSIDFLNCDEFALETNPECAGKESHYNETAVQPSLKTDEQFRGFSSLTAAGNRDVPVHRWVPWVAGYSRDFVAEALDRHARPGCTVLDPFAGVGTTLLEAKLAGFDAVGFEINPYAVLAVEVKLDALEMKPSLLRNAGKAIAEHGARAEAAGSAPRSRPPGGFRSRRSLYSEKVLEKVLHALDAIEGLRNPRIRKACRLAFASTMIEYSNYSYEPSLGSRRSAGKPDIDDHPVCERIAQKLDQMADDCEWAASSSVASNNNAAIHQRSFLDDGDLVPEGSVSLLVTSPPYLNNYHYNRNTRPQLYWLGLCSSPEDTKKLEELNFGTYWQNARAKDRLPLDRSARDRRIVDALARVRRQRPDKAEYGGEGWANYATQYFNDCARFARMAHRAIEPGGTALVVIGNSILQGVHIPTDEFFGLIAQANGLEAVEIHRPRSERVGNSIVNSSVRADNGNHSTKLYEAVVELHRVRRSSVQLS